MLKIFKKIKNLFKKKKKSQIITNEKSQIIENTTPQPKTTSYVENKSLMSELLNFLKVNQEFVSSQMIIKYLKQMFDITITAAFLRTLIAKLRQQGNPIVATQKGYLYTTNSSDIHEYVRRRYKEINREIKVLEAMNEI